MKKLAPVLIFVLVNTLNWCSARAQRVETLQPQSRTQIISGRVMDTLNQPIARASVVIWSNDRLIAGTVSDNSGRYRLYVDSVIQPMTLSITAAGYRDRQMKLSSAGQLLKFDVICEPTPIQLGSISMSPRGSNPASPLR